jgi:hypothetical protein
MSCIHIQGTRRTGDSAPFRFLGKKDRAAEVAANAKHENRAIRAAAAASPHADQDTLWKLGHDSELTVRQWVARNPKTELTLLWDMATDTDFSVRALVAWNPNADTELLGHMLNDSNLTVCRMAQTVLDNTLGYVYSS